MSNDQETQKAEELKVTAVDECTRKQIENALQQLKDPSSQAARRFEEFRAESEKILRPLSEAIRASEVLSDRDLAIRINTRD